MLIVVCPKFEISFQCYERKISLYSLGYSPSGTHPSPQSDIHRSSLYDRSAHPFLFLIHILERIPDQVACMDRTSQRRRRNEVHSENASPEGSDSPGSPLRDTDTGRFVSPLQYAQLNAANRGGIKFHEISTSVTLSTSTGEESSHRKQNSGSSIDKGR